MPTSAVARSDTRSSRNSRGGKSTKGEMMPLLGKAALSAAAVAAAYAILSKLRARIIGYLGRKDLVSDVALLTAYQRVVESNIEHNSLLAEPFLYAMLEVLSPGFVASHGGGSEHETFPRKVPNSVLRHAWLDEALLRMLWTRDPATVVASLKTLAAGRKLGTPPATLAAGLAASVTAQHQQQQQQQQQPPPSKGQGQERAPLVGGAPAVGRDASSANMNGLRPETFAACQVVNFCGSLDTRAWRLPVPPRCSWFELDSQQVQRAKLSAAKSAGCQVSQRGSPSLWKLHPDDFTCVAADAPDTATWRKLLSRARFDSSTTPTVWVMEGCLYLMEPPVVEAVLTAAAEMSAPGSVLLTTAVTSYFRQYQRQQRLAPKEKPVTAAELAVEKQPAGEQSASVVTGRRSSAGQPAAGAAGAAAHLKEGEQGEEGRTSAGQAPGGQQAEDTEAQGHKKPVRNLAPRKFSDSEKWSASPKELDPFLARCGWKMQLVADARSVADGQTLFLSEYPKGTPEKPLVVKTPYVYIVATVGK